MSLPPRELTQPRTDPEAESVTAMGTSAFGRLYTEYFDGLYDFVARIVRDDDLAGEIVQTTFTKAWDELRAGTELRHPKTWLYLVARNQAIDELRHRSRLAGEPVVYAQVDPSRLSDPQAVAEDNEIVELVWSSAAALNPDEYSLLHMHVRQGFGAAELADALELERGAVYTRLSRLRNSLEESVTSTLLVRRGRDECPELAAIVAEHEVADTITPALRRAVRDHVAHCEICADSRRRLVAPGALFGALVPIVPLAGMRDGILAAILPDGGHAVAAGATGAAGGAAAVATARHASKARYLAAGGGIAAAAAIVAVALSSGPSVKDPARASSVDHAVGVPSTDRTVAMRWQPGKNAKGYSVMFSRDRSAEPPARENVTGTRYTSAPLTPGSWWFILRTHGRNGSWTHTLRVGPFVIAAATAALPREPAKPAKHAKERSAQRKREEPRPSRGTAPPIRGRQLIAGVHAERPRATEPARPAPPKPKTKTKPKKAKPPKPPAPPAPVPQSQPQQSPPAQAPVAQAPPATGPAPTEHADDEPGEREHEDQDGHEDEGHQGDEDHRGEGSHGHDD
jgi:RNA polymerase sigma factor (sigma-70 family)